MRKASAGSGTTAGPAYTAIPLPTLARWVTRLQHLASDIEVGLPQRAAAEVARLLAAELSAAHRAAARALTEEASA